MTPEQMYNEAVLLNSKGRHAVPASYFKLAAVSAAEHFIDIKKTTVRGAIFIEGDERGLLELSYDSVEMREDVIELARGPRSYFRPEYFGWSVTLPIEYNATVLSAGDLVELLEESGQEIGIGRRRPEEKGTHGTFTMLS